MANIHLHKWQDPPPIQDYASTQRALRESAGKLDIDFKNIKIAYPMWGAGAKTDYANDREYTFSGSGAEHTEDGIDFAGTGYIEVSNGASARPFKSSEVQASGLTMIATIKSDKFGEKSGDVEHLLSGAGDIAHSGPSAGGIHILHGTSYDVVYSKIYVGSYVTLNNTSNLNIDPQKDHTIIAVWDTEKNTSKLFIDRVLIGSGSFAGESYSFGPNYFNIGADYKDDNIFDRLFKQALVLTCPISDDVVYDISDNPFRFWQPTVKPESFDLAQSGVLPINIITGPPVLGTPTLGQNHQLNADGIVTGAPSLGSPALSSATTHNLIANDIETATPVLGTPIIGQSHVLTASNILTGSPVVGTPALSSDNTHELTATGITTGPPAIGSPGIGQIHILSAIPLILGSPDLGSPRLNWTQPEVPGERIFTVGYEDRTYVINYEDRTLTV